MGAIQSAQGRADAQCARLTKENEALREELRDVVKRGVSDLSNSSTKDEPFAARKQQIVTSSSGSGSSGDSSGGSSGARPTVKMETSIILAAPSPRPTPLWTPS